MEVLKSIWNLVCNVLKNPTSSGVLFILSSIMGSSESALFTISLTRYENNYVFNFSFMKIVLLVWFIWTLLTKLITLNDSKYIKERELLNETIDEYKKRVDNNAYLLMSKYDELRKFRDRDKLRKILKEFTEKNPIVYSSQIYKYVIHTDKKITNVKVTHQSGYTSEGIDTNTILQSYYYMANDNYKAIKNIIQLWKNIKLDNKENEVHSKSLNDKFVESVISFSQKTINHLNQKKKSKINDNDSALYGALRMVLENLFNSDEKQLEFEQILKDQDKEDLLFNMKRTGILCSILSESPYIFMHNGISSKRGRVYISLCVKINNVKYNILLSTSSEILRRNSWEECMRAYAMELQNILQEEFDVISLD